MHQAVFSEDLKNIENLKNNLDSGKISSSDVPVEYINILNVLYRIEIDQARENIEEMNDEIEDYKKRMRNAINYLKDKKK